MTIAEAFSRHAREYETAARMFSDLEEQRARIYDNSRTIETERQEITAYFENTDRLLAASTEILKHDRELLEMLKARLKGKEWDYGKEQRRPPAVL